MRSIAPRIIFSIVALLLVASTSYWAGQSTTYLNCQMQRNDVSFGGMVENSYQNREMTSSGFNNGRSIDFMKTWEKNTVIVTISFGNATQTNLLERLLYSLRHNGMWQGRVVVLTDNADHYNTILGKNNPGSSSSTTTSNDYSNVDILPVQNEHLHPNDPKTGKPLVFINDAMRFKRFKTLIFDYLDPLYYQDSKDGGSSAMTHLDRPYEHVLYLDVEIIVARPMHSFFQDYLDQMTERELFLDEHAHVNMTVNGGKHFMSFFSDCPKCGRQRNFNLNGGVFLLHRQYSRDCLQEWQNLFRMGADYVTADQRYLVTMSVLAKKPICKFWKLPDNHRLYPSRKDMRLKRSATIVHNTNTYNAKKIPAQVQNAYFSYLLNTTQFSKDALELF